MEVTNVQQIVLALANSFDPEYTNDHNWYRAKELVEPFVDLLQRAAEVLDMEGEHDLSHEIQVFIAGF